MSSKAALTYLYAVMIAAINSRVTIVKAQGQMVKMCLFYEHPSGHARSDPIVNQSCASDHVHTFYGPLDFHPDTIYEDLINVIDTPQYSTSPFIENQSLYWHPSIYRVTENSDGTETFTRVSNLESSPYYRWDKSVTPIVEAFPPEFRMIAGSNDPGAVPGGGEGAAAMFTECCNYDANGDEDCVSWDGMVFPSQPCGFVGLALNMPTCWDGRIDSDDHRSHMAYTMDGTVAGQCPNGFNRRLPQIQLFVRITNYLGGRYQLSDGNTNVWHVDFFNGWQVGKLQEIINGCEYSDQDPGEFNPPCDCTFGEEIEQPFLTPSNEVPDTMCDSDVRRLIVNEVTDVVTNALPRGTCEGSSLIAKSWNVPRDDMYTCDSNPPPTEAPVTPSPTEAPVTPPPTEAPVTPSPTEAPVTPTPTEAPVTPPPTEAPVTPPPTTQPSISDMRWVVCGRGVGDGLNECSEGDNQLANAEDENEVHEIRCCKEGGGRGWKQQCEDYNPQVYARSKDINKDCREGPFWDAFDMCEELGGRLCTRDEVLNSCTKGTGCGHDHDLIWTCVEEDRPCLESSECCSGLCNDGHCIVEMDEEDGPSNMRWVVCGRGVGDGLDACSEGDEQLVNAEDESEEHEIRCCKEGEGGEGWMQKCEDYNPDVFARSWVLDECRESNFWEAHGICELEGGRLCTKDELKNSCTKGTGCGHDAHLIWTCTEEGGPCSDNTECCSGWCDDNGYCAVVE